MPALLSRLFSSSLPIPRDVQQNPYAGQADHQGRSTIADERQCKTFGRQQSRHDTGIDQRLDADERRDADSQVAAKRNSRPGGDLKSSGHEECEEQHDDSRSNEPKLFADECQHKIGMGFREKEQLLLAFPQPNPEESPAAECQE